MKLRKFSLTGGLILSVIIFTSHLFFSNFIIQNGFSKIEQQHILNNLHAAQHEIANKVKQLDAFVWDWASWDDTYAFVQDGNRLYVESNLTQNTFLDQGLTAFIIRNIQGETIYARALTSKGNDDHSLLEKIQIISKEQLPSLDGEDQGKGGIARINEAFYLIASRPILTSEGQGPAKGTIIMVKPLSAEIVETISKSLGFPIRVLAMKADALLSRKLQQSETGEITRDIDDATALGASLLKTLGSDPAALVQVTVDRQISRYGQKVTTYNTIIIALAIFLFAALTFFLLHYKFLRRLERLDSQVATLALANKDHTLVDVEGADEISALADSINTLLTQRDLSHREQLAQAEEIANNEQFLQEILNSISVGIMLVDPDSRRIISINDHALEMAGRTRQEVLNKVCHRLTCPAELNDCPILDRHQPHDLSKRELLTSDGGSIPIMKSVTFVEKNGQPLLLETIIDITEIEQARLELEDIKKGLEKIVAERTKDLAEANKELVALDKAKTLFLSSASHELRTPLTSILGFIKLMEKRFNQVFYPHLTQDADIKPQAVQFMENLSVVRSEAERLGRLVNDLLDLNKIQSGRMEWRDERLDIHDLLSRAGEAFTGQALGKPQVEFLVEQPTKTLAINADQDRIQQVLINLLGNAFKFTEKGHVRLSVDSEESFVTFRVCDTGKGISRADKKQVFDLFYQVWDENQRSSKEFGTGLGLAICRQIVTHYGGTISVESSEGEGSCFQFTIPKASPDEA